MAIILFPKRVTINSFLRFKTERLIGAVKEIKQATEAFWCGTQAKKEK